MSQDFTNLQIAFSPESLFVLNLSIAFIMFGVALGIKKSEFVEIRQNPKSVIVGSLSQFVFLPLSTFLLILAIGPLPELALGMILVAACPGGNVSNFFSQQSNGNVALSVSLTGIASIAAIFLTPFNFELYSTLYEVKLIGNRAIELEFFDIVEKVMVILILPLLLGLVFAKKFPEITKKIQKPISLLSFLILLVFMVVAFSKNVEVFSAYYKYILVLVFLHNGLSFAVGYTSGAVFKLPMKDIRTITIETGIQNSGLALAIIFSVFDGNGGMALLAAWWGIWHILAGTTISFFFKRANTQSF
jgi:BASS family bile acid:Na+ symporter